MYIFANDVKIYEHTAAGEKLIDVFLMAES